VFAAFQAATALLLLSAASSSFQAGPGLLKALARGATPGASKHGVLPAAFGRMNRHHVPLAGVAVFFGIAALVVIAGGARDQELVLFYAVAVFVSFLMGLTAMAFFAYRERHYGWLTLNVAAAIAVAFTLVANLFRPAAIGSLAVTALVAGGLYYAWVRVGRPRGASHAIAEAEKPDNEVV
jgi:amino acid transporter